VGKDGIITSFANERLKQARRVREGKEPDLIFVEGGRLVEECFQSNLKLSACFHTPDPPPRIQAILEEMAKRSCPLFSIAEPLMAKLSDTQSPQGVIVLATRPRSRLEAFLETRQPLIIGLEAVQDPGNFGTILRTAEAAGATGVIASKGCVEAFAPKTLRSAMGSAFRLPMVSDVDIERLLGTLQEKGIRVVATDAHGEIIYTEYEWRQPTMLILGNEARGVSAELLERSDARLRIPLCAPVESLNVAAAAAAVLFEAARQRGSRSNHEYD
jgi:TrmH family RNA methyltransferase